MSYLSLLTYQLIKDENVNGGKKLILREGYNKYGRQEKKVVWIVPKKRSLDVGE